MEPPAFPGTARCERVTVLLRLSEVFLFLSLIGLPKGEATTELGAAKFMGKMMENRKNAMNFGTPISGIPLGVGPTGSDPKWAMVLHLG